MGYLWRNACSQITKTSKSGRADSYDTDANQLFKSLNWKNLETRRQISKAEMVYKSINGLAPKYLFNAVMLILTIYQILRISLLFLLAAGAGFVKFVP